MLRPVTFLSCLVLLSMPLMALASVEIVKPDAKEQNSAPIKINIVPHRAIYTMSLGSVKNGSNISGVSGKMMFEWADSCDGWATTQQMQMHFVYSEGDESDATSNIVTWEAKDGHSYRFNVRRATNDKETESYRGKAALSAHEGSGRYTIPKNKEVKLSSDTIFPSAHTTLILQKAVRGEKLFTRPVFDGADEDGLSDVSVFIGKRQDDPQAAEMNPSLKKNALLATPGWPVRLAFFKPKSETGEPDYEMNLFLQTNGVARSMQIDYGDFSVMGVLTELEALPSPGC